MLKFEDNPPLLSPRLRSVRDAEGPWWVAHTRSRFEKAFCHDLIRADVPHFLPMTENRIFSGKRKRRLMVPLFPSYVFFAGQAPEHAAALATGRVCQILPIADQAKFIDEIALIERVLASGEEIRPYPTPALGERCRITAGPFMGVEGTVVNLRPKAQLVLSISVLGRGALLEIDHNELEIVSHARSETA